MPDYSNLFIDVCTITLIYFIIHFTSKYFIRVGIQRFILQSYHVSSVSNLFNRGNSLDSPILLRIESHSQIDLTILSKSNNYANYICSTINAIFCVCSGIYILNHINYYSVIAIELVDNNSINLYFLQLIYSSVLSYFLYDLYFVCFLEPKVPFSIDHHEEVNIFNEYECLHNITNCFITIIKWINIDWIMFIHHILFISICYITFSYNYCLYLGGFLLIQELSSPIVSLWKVLKDFSWNVSDLSSSKKILIYNILSLFMSLSFITVRVILLFYGLIKTWTHPDFNKEYGYTGTISYYWSVILLGALLQVFWSFKIIRGWFKLLRKNRTNSNTNIVVDSSSDAISNTSCFSA